MVTLQDLEGLMRVLVCGGRNFQDVPFLWRKLDELHARGDGIALVIEGGSDAVAGEYYGADYWGRGGGEGRKVRWERCGAGWDRFGRWAGPKRNMEMID